MPSVAYRQEILAEYVDLAGALMRRDYITYTDRVPDKLKVGIGVDLAISKRDGADYTAIVVMGYEEATGHRYVLDVVRERCSFNETLRLIQKVAEKHNPHKVLIEEVQFQASVVQELTRTTSLPIKGYKPDRDKVTRFHELLARYEQGLVFHRRGILPEFDNELLAFPESEHDDMVDAAVYAHQACTAKARAGVVFI
jgi:predicted phage terminase large subunit-like protein